MSALCCIYIINGESKLKLYELLLVRIFIGRLEKWAAVFGVFRLLWLSFNLAYVELSLNAGTLMDEGYCLIFWIQTVTVLLPFGKVHKSLLILLAYKPLFGQVSFILLELFGFLTMTYNAYDTLFLDGSGKNDFLETFQKAFNGNYLKMQFMLRDLQGSLKHLENSISTGASESEAVADPNFAKLISELVENYKTEF